MLLRGGRCFRCSLCVPAPCSDCVCCPPACPQVLFTAGAAEALLEEMTFWIKEHAGRVPPMWGTPAAPPVAAADGGADGTA